MGNLATPEALIARWEELIRDPSLRNLPYKIELNTWGKVEMSPASNRHGRIQGELAAELKRQLGGSVITECSVVTRIGIRVPDVVWASPDFLASYGEVTPYMRAPEICVEILSPSNVQAEVEAKRRAYLEAGAQEVWFVTQDGTIHYYGPAGEKVRSDFPVMISLPPPMRYTP